MPRTKTVTTTEPTTVINANAPEKPKEITKADKVLVAYNGVQAQIFDFKTKTGKRVKAVINGNNADLIGKMKGSLYAGGYGLTTLDRETWEAIKTAYAKWGPIKNGLMFATDSAHASAEIKARKDLKNGFEPLSPTGITGVEQRA